MTKLRPLATARAALRRARLNRLRRTIARERARLSDLRQGSADVLAAQVRRIAELEGRFLAALPSAPVTSRSVAREIERREKLPLIAA